MEIGQSGFLFCYFASFEQLDQVLKVARQVFEHFELALELVWKLKVLLT